MSTKNIPLGSASGTFASGDDARFAQITQNTSDITAKANKGANSDITSLSGLTTALSVAQGGTGSATQNFVDLTTTQSVAGVKNFTGTVNVPSPTVTGNAATKGYVDSLVASSVTDASASSKGVIQLAGDLGGTAAVPYVLGGAVLVYNYMPNPSFETDYSYWTSYGTLGTLTRTNTMSAVGSFSSQQTNVTLQDGGLLSSGITLQAGTYTFSFYMMMSSDVTNASVIMQGSSGIILRFNKAYASASDASWTQYNGNFTLGSAQSVSLLVGMGSYGPTSKGTVYYDGFSIQAGSGNYTYFDGSSPASGNVSYAWTSNPNLSPSTKQARVRLQSTDQLAEGTSNLYFTSARAWTNPVFTGTVSGVTKAMVGLSNVDNVADTNKPVSTAQAAADLVAQSQVVGINAQTAAVYTLTLTDPGKVIEMNNGAANTVTIPPNSSAAFAVGTIIEVFQAGTGQTSIAAGTGVTLRAPIGAKCAAQYASIVLRKRAIDEWVISGYAVQ